MYTLILALILTITVTSSTSKFTPPFLTKFIDWSTVNPPNVIKNGGNSTVLESYIEMFSKISHTNITAANFTTTKIEEFNNLSGIRLGMFIGSGPVILTIDSTDLYYILTTINDDNYYTDHTVLGVGIYYDINHNLYFKYQNSWGSEWGDFGHGYIRITKDDGETLVNNLGVLTKITQYRIQTESDLLIGILMIVGPLVIIFIFIILIKYVIHTLKLAVGFIKLHIN